MQPETPSQLPPHRTRRISLTKTQLRSALGAELLSLCQTVTADGALSPEELEDLRTWLEDSRGSDLPSISYLREVVVGILSDGKVTPEELQQLYRAVESVLPPEVRRQARDARKAVERQERARAKLAKEHEREKERAERLRNRPVASANFMVAGCRYEGRPRVIEHYARAGDAVSLVRDPANRFSTNAIRVCVSNGQQIGFVPEMDAREFSPLLDQGARAKAHLTKILSGGRSPIPVVQAYLFAGDAAIESRVPAEATATSRGIGWLVLLGLVVGTVALLVMLAS